MTDPSLKFAHANVGYVLDGLETATVRYGLDREIQADDLVVFLTPGGQPFAQAVVRDVVQVPVRHAMMPLQAEAHPADDVFDLLDRLNGHYDDDLTMDTPVQVVKFDVQDIPLEQPVDRRQTTDP
jgi:hypothetical protein